MGMGADYYNTLKVNRNATDDDLRKSYKRLAMIWHPDRNPTAEAEPKFKQISEAYEVLSNPQKRRFYDLYGEEALKSGEVPSPPSSSSSSAGAGRTIPPRKAPAVECQLPCNLEELYKGARRKMKISRDVITDPLSGKVRAVEEVLTIDIKPGWKKGTKITFPEKGNQGLGIIPSDLVFVVDEKPHAVYNRDGNDLVFSPEITLLEALTGKTFDLTTLDGRALTIQVTDIVRPGYEVVIPHEGMPISKEPSTKGRLRIKFDVKYPARITEEQKAELIRTLGGIS